MKLVKAFKHAFNMVVHSKLRSWLTILGIVIGVASVISIISLGDALQADMTSQLGDLGGDILTVTAGASKAQKFGPGRMKFGGGGVATEDEVVVDKTDLQVLKGISNIKLFDTQISGNADIYYLAKKGTVLVKGVDSSTWSQITTMDVADGRMLGSADTNVIVIGGRIADGFFEDKILGVNQLVTIEDKLFRIVGVLDDSSTSVYMPINSAYEILDDKEKGVYDSIIIKVKNEDELETVIENIENKLMLKRHVTEKKKDFSIYSNKQSNEARAEMMGSLTSFLAAIAAVALLVGAVGIANTMFTSVLEKTKEIGIMKAIGARNNDILMIFLLNAALIGLIGGLLGVFFGVLLSGILPSLMGGSSGMIGKMGSAGSVVSLSSVFWALGISVFIGVASGVIPAYQASRLRPVDALRYE
jgi:putative ABC transport system permease protein